MEKIDFEITEPVTPGSDNNESSGYFNHLSSSMDSDNKMPLTVWIDNGPMENYMYRKKESFLSKNNMIDRNDALDTDTESLESFKYTYPVDKVRIRDLVQLIILHSAKKENYIFIAFVRIL